MHLLLKTKRQADENCPRHAASVPEDGAARHVVAAFRAGADAALVERAARGAAPSGAVRAHLYHLLPTGVQKKHRADCSSLKSSMCR